MSFGYLANTDRPEPVDDPTDESCWNDPRVNTDARMRGMANDLADTVELARSRLDNSEGNLDWLFLRLVLIENASCDLRKMADEVANDNNN